MWSWTRSGESNARAEATEREHVVSSPPGSPMSVQMEEWLQAEGLTSLRTALAWNGYKDLELLCDLSPSEDEELFQVFRPRTGYVARLRRALQTLRQPRRAACAGIADSELSEMPVPPTPATASNQVSAFVSTVPVRSSPAEAPATSETSAGSSANRRPLRVGSHVRLHGLEKRPELNGSCGRLAAFDPSDGRWQLALADGKGTIRVRPENVTLEPESKGSSSISGATAESDIPEEFRCVITRDLMERPVITSDGHTYERSAIAKWLEEHSTSPKTGQELPDKVLRPNHALRAQIIAYRERKGLPSLPPWEPEPQEVVRPTRPPGHQGPGQVHVQSTTITLQTPARHIMATSGNAAAHRGVPASASPMGEVDARRLGALVQEQPELEQLLRTVWAEAHGAADGSQVPRSALVEATMQDPLMLHAFVQWVHTCQNPEVLHAIQAHNSQNPGSGPGPLAQPADNPLFRAAREGNCGVLERLLGDKHGEQLLQEATPSGDTLLHTAAWHGQSRIATMLLARGHPVVQPARNRSAPLHYAAWQGSVEVAKVLLQGRANMEQRMVGGDTALHQAAWQGHVAVLRLLADEGASLFALKDDGDTALALAAFRGHLASCRELLSRMTASGDGDAPFWQRVKNYYGCGPLHCGASSGNAEVVRLLLDAKAPVREESSQEETVLHRAIHSGSQACVELLLQSSCPLEVPRPNDAATPLMMAVLDGYTRIAKVLLEARACLDRCRADGLSPLHAAVLREATLPPRAGEASMIALLAEARADPEVRTRQGVSPLSLLMSSSVNAPHRSTALHNLIDIKADVNRPIAGDGTRPLHATVHHNLRVEAALLLERAADPNAAHGDGTAPLHLAVSAGAAPFVDLLLNSRADATATTQSGQTALDLARHHGFRAIEDRLRQ